MDIVPAACPDAPMGSIDRAISIDQLFNSPAVLIISELRPPFRRDLLHYLAVAISTVVREPRSYLSNLNPIFHHKSHGVLQFVVALRSIEFVLDMIDLFADGFLAGRERIDESL